MDPENGLNTPLTETGPDTGPDTDTRTCAGAHDWLRNRYPVWLFFTYGVYSAVTLVPLAYWVDRWVVHSQDPFQGDTPTERTCPNCYVVSRLVYSLVTVCLFLLATYRSRPPAQWIERFASFGVVFSHPASFWLYWLPGFGFATWGIMFSRDFSQKGLVVITAFDLLYMCLFATGRGLCF